MGISTFILLFVSTATAQSGAWGQCGGSGWTGATTCVGGYDCTYSNQWYSQCLPGTGSSSTTLVTSTASARSSTSATSIRSSSTSTSASASATSTSLTQFAGVNIAGFDFGCTTDGTCIITGTSGPYPPLPSYGGPDGPGQMSHFVKDDHMNIFRLPVGWQFLVNGVLGGTLNSANLSEYNTLVQACLSTGAYCIIDIHNYARWNGGIIGQGGPTNAQFVSLWAQLATYYASDSKILFGIVNEPHDLTVTTWAQTVQAVVTAIRQAGATSQMILLPGSDYTSAGSFISDGSAAALAAVKNPDGTTTNLIFDVHKYLDSDNSGGGGDCVTNNIATAFQPLATWLNSVGREALLTETGGISSTACAKYMCEQIAFLNQNSNVFLGYVGWGAGSFATTYALSLTPTNSNGVWTDQPLVKECFAR
ncbi:glycoside hydrolase superfamily [Hyaloscypha finlandica]|nr:glycoside hydrolase superfamily [Hyaloscypha finlandica]